MNKTIRKWLGTMLYVCVALNSSAQFEVTKVDEWLIGNDAQPIGVDDALNKRISIISANGYQYTAYWSINGSDMSKRYVTVARRALPNGAWESVQLGDYVQTIDDSHRAVIMAICEGDGTIHLSFDHHNDDLNYRISVQGLVSNPANHAWTASKFGPVRDTLPGMEESVVTSFTYPRFTVMPNGGLHLRYRKGSAKNGKVILFTYNPTTHEWSKNGTVVNGSSAYFPSPWGDITDPLDTRLGPYVSDLTYDENNRLHMSWVWRPKSDEIPRNFDIMYAYSDDYGVTWYNNDDAFAGTTEADPLEYQDDPNCRVMIYPPDPSPLANYNGQIIDASGRLHVVQKMDGKFLHIYRNTAGEWIENKTAIGGGAHRFMADEYDNIFMVTQGARIYAATAANRFKDWNQIYAGDAGRFRGEAIIDDSRWKQDGIITLIGFDAVSTQELYSVDYDLSSFPVSVSTYGNGGIPGSGEPWQIHESDSTRIEMENFDEATAGLAYFDRSPGNGPGAYRTTDVDIKDSSDTNGGYDVTQTAWGEWMQYTLQVPVAGKYDLTFRYSNSQEADAAVQFMANGAVLLDEILLAGTGSSSVYTNTATAQVDLGAGYNLVRIVVRYGNTIALNWFELKKTTWPIITMVTLGTPVVLHEGTTWSDGLPAHSEADYVVPDTGNLGSRWGTSIFPGRKLTVEAGGKFQFRAKEELGETMTVNDLILTDGTSGKPVVLAAGSGNNTTNHLAGSITTDGTSTLLGYGNATGPRNIRISSEISGDGTLFSTGTFGYPHTCIIGNAANTFAGVWESNIGTLLFESANAIGSASIEVLANGKLEIQGDWISESTLTVADTATANVQLGSYRWIVSGLVFGGASVADGTYSASELNALGANPVFTGSGTISIASGGLVSNTIYSDLADNSPRKEDGKDPVSSAFTADDPELFAGRSGTGGSVERCVVFPLQLPSLGVTLAPFTDATFTFNLLSNDFDPLDCNLDLYGLGVRDEATVLGSDYYSETDVADSTPGTVRLQDDLCTPATAAGIISNSNSALVNYLNAQYANGANAGKFVFLRLSKDAAVGTSTKKYTVMTADGAITNNAGSADYTVWPQIAYTAISAPVEPPQLEMTPGTNDMSFNWTGNGFKVQTRTNLIEGVWIDVPGGDTPPVNVIPTNSEAYFRLINN